MKKIILAFIILASSFTFLASPVHAIISNPVITNGSVQATAPETYFNSVLQAIFAVFSIFAIVKFVGTVLGITGLSNLTITWPSL